VSTVVFVVACGAPAVSSLSVSSFPSHRIGVCVCVCVVRVQVTGLNQHVCLLQRHMPQLGIVCNVQ
jgi:hypothetical protein